MLKPNDKDIEELTKLPANDIGRTIARNRAYIRKLEHKIKQMEKRLDYVEGVYNPPDKVN